MLPIARTSDWTIYNLSPGAGGVQEARLFAPSSGVSLLRAYLEFAAAACLGAGRRQAKWLSQQAETAAEWLSQ